MNRRVTNIALLLLLAVLSLTGAYGIVWPVPGWLYDAHRLASFVLIGLLPWKFGIAWRSLARGVGPGGDRNVVLVLSLFLAAATVVVLALGVIWAANVLPG